MQMLINPNVAYLLLMVGFVLAILAFLAPGTGILEVTALLALGVATYSIVQQSVNLWALGLMLVAAALLVLSIRRSRQYIFLGLSVIILIAGSLFFIQASAGSPGVNPILAVLVSLIACGLLFVAGSKGVEAMARKPFQNPDNLLTKTGEARTTVYKEGSVYINGENWSARSAKSIPSGTRIRVLKRDGLVLVVEALPPEG